MGQRQTRNPGASSEPEAERTDKQPGCRDSSEPVPPIPPGTDKRTAWLELHETTLLPTELCSQQENLKKAAKTKVLGARRSALGRGTLSSQYPHNPLLLTNALLQPAASSERDCFRVAGFPGYTLPQTLSPGTRAPPCGHLSLCPQVASLDCLSGRAKVSNLNKVEEG